MADLKPCPFCGRDMQPRHALWPSDGDTDAVIHAEPTECGLAGGFSIGTADNGVSVAAAWNRRAEVVPPTLDPNKVQICRVAPFNYHNGQPCACPEGTCSLWRGGMRPAPLSRNDAEKDAKDATYSGAKKP